MPEEEPLLSLADGTEVRWATDVEIDGLATELAGERELTDTLAHWRAVCWRPIGKPSVHILGRRLSRPVVTLTSPVVGLDRARGLAATRSGSLYKLIEPGKGPAAPEVILVLRRFFENQVFGGVHHQSRSEWPIARASAGCAACGGRFVAWFGQDAAHCKCRAAMLDITNGQIRGGGSVVDIRVEEHVRPMVEAPHDGRPVRVYWRGDEYRACWNEDAQGWREVGRSRLWLAEHLLGWAPWLG